MSNICSVNFLSYKIIFLAPLLHLGSDGFHVEVVFGAVHHLLHDAVLDVYFGVAAPMTIADYHHLLRVVCRPSGCFIYFNFYTKKPDTSCQGC